MGAGYGWQYEVLKCPFCEKGDISCKWYPSAVSEKQNARSSLGKKSSFNKSKEVWMVENGCSVCGKSQEEIEKELKSKGII